MPLDSIGFPSFDNEVTSAESFFKFQRDVSGIVGTVLCDEGLTPVDNQFFYGARLYDAIGKSNQRKKIEEFEYPIDITLIKNLWSITQNERWLYLILICLCSGLMSPSNNPKRALYDETEGKIIPLNPSERPIEREDIIHKVLSNGGSINYQGLVTDDYYCDGESDRIKGIQMRAREKILPNFEQVDLMTFKRKLSKDSPELRDIFEKFERRELSDSEFKALAKKIKSLYEEELYNHDPRTIQFVLALEGFYISRSKSKLRDSLISPQGKRVNYVEAENYFGSGLPVFPEIEGRNQAAIESVAELLGLVDPKFYKMVSAGSQKVFKLLGASEDEYMRFNGDRMHDSQVWSRRDDIKMEGMKMIQAGYFNI